MHGKKEAVKIEQSSKKLSCSMFGTSRIDALEVESEVKPVDLRREDLAV